MRWPWRPWAVHPARGGAGPEPCVVLQYGLPKPHARPRAPLSRRGANQEGAMPVLERIKAEVEGHPIVLFMKSTAQFPMCGFSSRTVQALKAAGVGELHTVNVLEEPEIRANLTRYCNWTTITQLFIHGELIGGCAITMELSESGDRKGAV